MGRNGKEERDDSSEVNLINRMGEKLLFRNRRRGGWGVTTEGETWVTEVVRVKKEREESERYGRKVLTCSPN